MAETDASEEPEAMGLITQWSLQLICFSAVAVFWLAFLVAIVK